VQSFDNCTKLDFDLSDCHQTTFSRNGNDYSDFTFENEGTTYDSDKPMLPVVSRFVVVPPNAGLEFAFEVESSEILSNVPPPELCVDEDLETDLNRDGSVDESIYPPVVAEMSRPMVIRGVRLVKVTVYPVQYNCVSGSFIRNKGIKTEIRYTNGTPENPVKNPNRRNRSREFRRFMRSLAINGEQVGRDDPAPDFEDEYVGHYLIVTHQNCLEYAAPFIEWRRKGGYKVDILSLNSGQAQNEDFVRDRIQERYDDYIDQGIDPFDHILLIGDRTEYYTEPDPNWILDAHRDQSVWHSGANHADYIYALLEGDDIYPDVAFSRWPSGSRDLMELAVQKTLLYEATPEMDDTDWYTRGGVLSQHWGNNRESAWHITIHTVVRWAEEVLQSIGYDDITFYENYDWDHDGDVVGPVVRDLFNAGSNLIAGRIQNNYFRWTLQGVEHNTVFPIYIANAGHGEATLDLIFRSGSGRELKGAVAGTGGWGVTPTAPTNAVWMEMVNSFLLHDLDFGWARNRAIIDIERYFPDFRCANGAWLYQHVKTDFDAYGDPALKSWIGIPRVLDFEFPDVVHPECRTVEVRVFDPENRDGVEAAEVTIYAPGNIPDPDSDEYADYDDMFMVTKKTGVDGYVRFNFDEGMSFQDGVVYVTVTGRDIRPLFGEMSVDLPARSVEVAEYSLNQIDGNGDENINPDEVFSLAITAVNNGEDDLNGVTAVISSSSPFVEIENPDMSFGNVDSGQEVESEDNPQLIISRSCPDGASRPVTRPEIIVDFSCGDDSWRSCILLNPCSPNLELSRVVGGGIIGLRDEELNIEISNIGSVDSDELNAQLIPLSQGVLVISANSQYRSIASGSRIRLRENRFIVCGNGFAIPGSKHEMLLILTQENGFVDRVYFELQVGEERENAPFGPDNYGYLCFDDTDGDWEQAPWYDWVEICPDEEGNDYDGVLMDFDGRSEFDIGEAIAVPLPFISQFYGMEFDTITVCTNGFISIGNQPRITNFQNYPLDRGIGGGVGMIAPLWDNLALLRNSGIYYYYDENQHRMIIQWHRLFQRNNGRDELTFEVILYDKEFSLNPSGDSDILMQYKSIANIEGSRDWSVTVPYASVGISSPDGTTGLSYSFNDEYPVPAAPLQNRRAILFSAFNTDCHTGVLQGVVTDFSTDQPIENVIIRTSNGKISFSGEDGSWIIGNAFAGIPFDITASANGYQDSILVDLIVDYNDTLEINFALLNSTFQPSTLNLSSIQHPDTRRELPFRIENTGNGPLDWSVDFRFPANEEFSPWELRDDFDVSRILNDLRINGVVYVHNLLYLSGSNASRPTIYILNREGELVDTLAQPGDDEVGMRDLTFDGELIWGTSEQMVIGMSTEGEVMGIFQGPYNSVSVITWDSERECLWLGNATDNPVAYDREGNRIDELEINTQGYEITGYAYRADDPDSSNLYILGFEQESERQTVHKVNINTNELNFCSYLDPENDRYPGGCEICDVYFGTSRVLLNISNNTARNGWDRLNIWHLAGNTDWFSFEIEAENGRAGAENGRILPGEFTDFILTLDSEMLESGIYEAEILFNHNAEFGNTLITCVLEVVDPVPPSAFGLLEPANGDTLYSTLVDFSWNSSDDPNEIENVTYEFWAQFGEDSLSISLVDTSLAIGLDTLWNSFESDALINWWVTAISGESSTECDRRFQFELIESDVGIDRELIPYEFSITSVYPNPFNSNAVINFENDRIGDVSLKIYDLSGREIADVHHGILPAGSYTKVWVGRGYPSGIYVVQLASFGERKFVKVLKIK